MPISSSVRRLSVVAAAFLLAGCNGNKDEAAAGPAKMDTTNQEWDDGLSAQQVQAEAQAISPEQAAQMGIAVDTSIHLEALDARDSVLSTRGQVSAPARGDSATAPAPIDTVP